MMIPRSILLALSFPPLISSVVLTFNCARADQILTAPTNTGGSIACQINGGGVSCTHFEGYVVVRRHDAALPAAASSSDAGLSDRRVYLPVGADRPPHF